MSEQSSPNEAENAPDATGEDAFDGSKTQLSLNSRQSKPRGYSELNEKVAVKSTRKKIEQDIQLLKNRVRMLQKEKEKADRKIVETKSKAEEIIKRKMENDALYQEKLKEKEKRERMEEERRAKMREEREQRRRSKPL